METSRFVSLPPGSDLGETSPVATTKPANAPFWEGLNKFISNVNDGVDTVESILKKPTGDATDKPVTVPGPSNGANSSTWKLVAYTAGGVLVVYGLFKIIAD